MLSRTAGGVTTHYEYDLLGNRVSASGPGSLIEIDYDRRGRPVSVTVDGDTGATTTYTYSLTSPAWADPSGTYSATFDAFDRQVTLLDPVNGSSEWSFASRDPAARSSLASWSRIGCSSVTTRPSQMPVRQLSAVHASTTAAGLVPTTDLGHATDPGGAASPSAN